MHQTLPLEKDSISSLHPYTSLAFEFSIPLPHPCPINHMLDLLESLNAPEHIDKCHGSAQMMDRCTLCQPATRFAIDFVIGSLPRRDQHILSATLTSEN